MIVRLLLSLLPFLPFGLVAPPRMMDYKFPAGTTYWTQPIIVEGQVGMTLTGTRTNGVPSRMVYRGAPGKFVIAFVGCTRCRLVDLEIVDESGCDATVLTTNAVDPGQSGFSTANEFRNVRVVPSTNGRASKRAFSVDSKVLGGQDANNDHHHFTDCVAYSYTECGVYVDGSQCHQLVFTRFIAADTTGRKSIGIHAAKGIYFAMRDCGFNGNETDVKLGGAEIQAVFDGINSENSERFLTYSFASGMPHVSVRNLRWEGKPVTGKPFVECVGFGPWSISNSFVSSQNGVPPTMRFAGLNGSLELSGVTMRQVGGAFPTAPLVTAPTTWQTRQYGVFHHHVPTIGLPTIKPVTVNKIPEVQ